MIVHAELSIPLSDLLEVHSLSGITKSALTDDLVDASTEDDAKAVGRLYRVYDAIGHAVKKLRYSDAGAPPEHLTLSGAGDVRFYFLRLDAEGQFNLAFEALPDDNRHCAGLLQDHALLHRAVATRSIVLQDRRAGEEPVDMPGACATCPVLPTGSVIVVPVLVEEQVIGVCRVVRCGADTDVMKAETFFLARLAKTVAAAEEYRLLRAQHAHELAEVQRGRQQQGRLERWLHLATHVACDIAYEFNIETGSLEIEQAGSAIQVPDRPVGVRTAVWWESLIHPEDSARCVAQYHQSKANPGVVNSLDYRLSNGDGGWRHVRHVFMVDPGFDSLPTMNIGAIKDVSDEVKARAQLASDRAHLETVVAERTLELTDANTDLARAARLKDEFLASMSHELRTPLNAILGMTEATLERIWGPLTDQQVEKLELVQESGQHLLSLINDILDLSKIGAGKLLPEVTMVDVKDTASSTLRLVSQLAMERRIHVETVLPEEGAMVQTDGRMLMQILLNLLNNAVKFTPPGGTVTVEVTNDASQDAVTCRVIDTGIGIAAEDMERLFQPFVQLQQGLSRPYGGTGLGLALVRRLAEQLHATVDVHSEVGKGSTFTVTVPRSAIPLSSDEDEDVVARITRLRTPQSRSTLLLAEDDEANVHTYVGYLQAKGYTVVVAKDGLEALAVARDVRPALILMDIQMPRLDGLEAIRQLRADPAFDDTPIIALTALAMPGDRERCMTAGSSGYISKPTSLKELREQIASYIGVPEAGVLS